MRHISADFLVKSSGIEGSLADSAFVPPSAQVMDPGSSAIESTDAPPLHAWDGGHVAEEARAFGS